MNTVYFDSDVPNDLRRQRLYQGQLFVYSPRPSTIALCQFGREMLEQAFGTHDPREAHEHMPVERFVEILAQLKPSFIHHPRCKQLIGDVLQDLGCELDKVYFDVPRLRTAAPQDYLTSGIAYAFHPHRDTWYSAPVCQLNWWLPIFDIESENSMAFHPRYWSQGVRNSSNGYNYYEWNREGRKSAAQHIKTDTRPQPRAEEPMELNPQIRLICPAGGLVLFSAAQMHSTVPNTAGRTRCSIDFRTVHIDDVVARAGAPNVDSACTGTTLRDYLRGTDLAHLPEPLVALYDDGTEIRGDVVYKP